MKTPTKTIRISDLDAGYGDYWLKMPRSVKVKWTKQFQQLSSQTDDPRAQEYASVELFSLVQEWNFDDDDGQALPLVKDAPDKAGCNLKKHVHADDCPKVAVVGEIPIEVFVFVAKQVAGGDNVPEDVAGFSNAS